MNIIRDIPVLLAASKAAIAAFEDIFSPHAATVSGEVARVAGDVGNVAGAVEGAGSALSDVAGLAPGGAVVAGVVTAAAAVVNAGASVVEDLANDAGTAQLPTTSAGRLDYGVTTIEKAMTDLFSGEANGDIHAVNAAFEDFKSKLAVVKPLAAA
jgi:hypothetical protein